MALMMAGALATPALPAAHLPPRLLPPEARVGPRAGVQTRAGGAQARCPGAPPRGRGPRRRALRPCHPAGDRYRLTLERSGQAALGSDSQGRLGAAGLAPERYVESRRGREQRAVNFQHEAGRITFSGPQLQYPLLPGAQDRLSWICLLYTSPSPRDRTRSRMPSSA